MNGMQAMMQKNALVVMKLTRDFLIVEPDTRVPTVAEYAEKFSVSPGTIHAAIKHLCHEGAIHLETRGHQGSYLCSSNKEKLWNFSGWNTLTGSMSLPLNTLASGLATGICQAMRERDIPFNAVFMQSSSTRLKALLSYRFDFLVASQLTADLVLSEYDEIELVLELTGSYYAQPYILMFADHISPQIEDGMTVAVDPTSIDQSFLTECVCHGKKVKQLHQTYIHTIESVHDGLADFVVSRLDVLQQMYPHATTKKIEFNLQGANVADKVGAVILARKDNYGLKAFLQYNMDLEMVSSLQKKVMEEELAPSYF